jgi:hypothetical protein
VNNGITSDKLTPIKQVTFNPNPVTIPVATSTTSNTVAASSTTSSPQSVKGTIPIADVSNPARVKNVLVSLPATSTAGGNPAAVSDDHTYAKKSDEKNDMTSSSEDCTTSDSDVEQIDMTKKDDSPILMSVVPPSSAPSRKTTVEATPTTTTHTTTTPIVLSVKRRGRPRKTFATPQTVPPAGVVPPKSILKTAPTSEPNSELKEISLSSKIRRRGRGCGSCIGCIREDCGKCSYCLDKPKYGGPGRKKQRCALRICSQFISFGKVCVYMIDYVSHCFISNVIIFYLHQIFLNHT